MTSNSKINLVLTAPGTAPAWSLGETFNGSGGPASFASAAEKGSAGCDAVLFWDPSVGPADEAAVLSLLRQPYDAWHAGLKLGMHGQPRAVDFVQPAWMLNCDPSPNLPASSWRVSLRACLVRTEVLKQMRCIQPGFESLEAAGLEMGHRWLTRGVFVRHEPGLLPPSTDAGRLKSVPSFSTHDELMFVFYRYRFSWVYWAAMRFFLTGRASFGKILRTVRKLRALKPALDPAPYRRPVPDVFPEREKISVLIPTLNRPYYLRRLLPQLRQQSVSPFEIIVVDQTAKGKRDGRLAEDFKDMPLKIIYRDEPGQCSARNEGLAASSGSVILFLDDDCEIFPDFIENHLRNLESGNGVSSGVIYETGMKSLPENFSFLRISDVFPAGNSMARRSVLEKSGLFDLAYNRKARADGDLGMRIYLSGETMLLSPEVRVVHHHAASGGLRTHKARVKTYAGSRQSIYKRHLLSDSEIYLGLRYFSKAQVSEAMWLSVFGTFSVRGPFLKKTAKLLHALLFLPDSILRIISSRQKAEAMLKEFPKIAKLEGSHCAS